MDESIQVIKDEQRNLPEKIICLQIFITYLAEIFAEELVSHLEIEIKPSTIQEFNFNSGIRRFAHGIEIRN